MEADAFHDQHIEFQHKMRGPIAFCIEMMGDIIYFNQAMKQPNASEFIKAVVKEVNAHVKNCHWMLVKYTEVPEGVGMIPAV